MSSAKATRPARSKRVQTPVREGRVAVVGLGYVGLPTACMFAVNGIRVLGVDVNRDIVDALLEGDSKRAEPEIRSLFNLALHSGNLEMATRVAASDVYVIAVPTPPLRPERLWWSNPRSRQAPCATWLSPHLYGTDWSRESTSCSLIVLSASCRERRW